jgi:hypothetical protein
MITTMLLAAAFTLGAASVNAQMAAKQAPRIKTLQKVQVKKTRVPVSTRKAFKANLKKVNTVAHKNRRQKINIINKVMPGRFSIGGNHTTGCIPEPPPYVKDHYVIKEFNYREPAEMKKKRARKVKYINEDILDINDAFGHPGGFEPAFTPIPDELRGLHGPAKDEPGCINDSNAFMGNDEEQRRYQLWLANHDENTGYGTSSAINDEFGICTPDDVQKDNDDSEADMDFTEDNEDVGSSGEESDDVDYDFTEDDDNDGKDPESSEDDSEDVDMDFGTDPDNIDVEDDGGSDDPEGDDRPDEMRDALKNDYLSQIALDSSVVMGDGAPPNATDQTGNNSATGGPSGLEIARDGLPGNHRNPEDGTDPAASEMGNPMGNFNHGMAMSPAVGGDGKENPGGPIGPVASENENMNTSLNFDAAGSDSSSPTVDDREAGVAPGGPISPVAEELQ